MFSSRSSVVAYALLENEKKRRNQKNQNENTHTHTHTRDKKTRVQSSARLNFPQGESYSAKENEEEENETPSTPADFTGAFSFSIEQFQSTLRYSWYIRENEGSYCFRILKAVIRHAEFHFDSSEGKAERKKRDAEREMPAPCDPFRIAVPGRATIDPRCPRGTRSLKRHEFPARFAAIVRFVRQK